MMVVPIATPVTTPPLTVAIDGADDVHVPPEGVPVNVVEPGKQIDGVPVTVGVVPTVTVV